MEVADERLTTEALAQRWFVPKSRIEQWVSIGAPLPPSFKIGAKRLFKLKKVIEFENSREAETSI